MVLFLKIAEFVFITFLREGILFGSNCSKISQIPFSHILKTQEMAGQVLT